MKIISAEPAPLQKILLCLLIASRLSAALVSFMSPSFSPFPKNISICVPFLYCYLLIKYVI